VLPSYQYTPNFYVAKDSPAKHLAYEVVMHASSDDAEEFYIGLYLQMFLIDCLYIKAFLRLYSSLILIFYLVMLFI